MVHLPLDRVAWMTVEPTIYQKPAATGRARRARPSRGAPAPRRSAGRPILRLPPLRLPRSICDSWEHELSSHGQEIPLAVVTGAEPILGCACCTTVIPPTVGSLPQVDDLLLRMAITMALIMAY